MLRWFQEIPRFIVRHRNKVAIASIVAIVMAIIASYYTPWKDYFITNEPQSVVDEPRPNKEGISGRSQQQRSGTLNGGTSYDVGRKGNNRSRLLLRVRRQFDSACKHFLPTLRKKIFDLIDINSTVRQIKELRNVSTSGQQPDAESQLWENVKISAFTMHFVTMYMLAAVCTLLKIQLHILARSIALSVSQKTQMAAVSSNSGNHYLDYDAGYDEDALSMDNEMFRELIEGTYRHLFNRGLKALATMIREIIIRDLADWTVKDKVKVDFEEVADIIKHVRVSIEKDFPRLIKMMFIPPASDDSSPSSPSPAQKHSIIVQKLLNQTWDVIESKAFEVVFVEAMDQCYRITQDHFSRLYNTEPHSPGMDMSSRAPPLASLLPQLKMLSARLLPDSPTTAMTSDIKQVSSGALLDSLCISIFDADEQD